MPHNVTAPPSFTPIPRPSGTAVPAPATQPASWYHPAPKGDPRLAQRPVQQHRDAGMPPRTQLPTQRNLDAKNPGPAPATGQPQPAWGTPVYPAAPAWAQPAPGPQGSPFFSGLGRLAQHARQAHQHSFDAGLFRRMAQAHSHGSPDQAYWQAGHAFHAGQARAHRHDAWQQMGNLFRPSFGSAGSAPAGPTHGFNPGWLAQNATLPAIRNALQAADDIIRLFLRR
jgi:hypothetical protein